MSTVPGPTGEGDLRQMLFSVPSIQCWVHRDIQFPPGKFPLNKPVILVPLSSPPKMALPKDGVWQDYMVHKLACMCRCSCWQGKRPSRYKDTVKHQCTGPELLHRSSSAQTNQDSWGGAELLHHYHQYSHTLLWVPCPDPLRGFHAGQLRYEKGSLDIIFLFFIFLKVFF